VVNPYTAIIDSAKAAAVIDSAKRTDTASAPVIVPVKTDSTGAVIPPVLVPGDSLKPLPPKIDSTGAPIPLPPGTVPPGLPPKLDSTGAVIPPPAGTYPPGMTPLPIKPDSGKGLVPPGTYPPGTTPLPLKPDSGKAAIPSPAGLYPPSALAPIPAKLDSLGKPLMVPSPGTPLPPGTAAVPMVALNQAPAGSIAANALNSVPQSPVPGTSVTSPVATANTPSPIVNLALSVSAPATNSVVKDPLVTIRGLSTAGAKVTIGNKEIPVSTDGSFSGTYDCQKGANTIAIVATLGTQKKNVSVLVTYQPPLVLAIKNITDNMEVVLPDLSVEYEATEGAQVTVSLNGKPSSNPLRLIVGRNVITVAAKDAIGATISKMVTVILKQKKDLVLNVLSPRDGLKITDRSIVVSGTTTPGASVTANGLKATVDAAGNFKAQLSLVGTGPDFPIAVRAQFEGQELSADITVTLDVALSLSISSPQDRLVTNKTDILVAGTAVAGARVFVNNFSVVTDPKGGFTYRMQIPDEEGDFTIEVRAEVAGKEVTQSRTVTYKPDRAPLILDVRTPADRSSVATSLLRVSGFTTPRATITVNGKNAAVTPTGQFTLDIQLSERDIGDYSIEIEAKDDYGQSQSKNLTVKVPVQSKQINTSIPTVTVVGLTTKASRNAGVQVQVSDRTPEDQLILTVTKNSRSEKIQMDPNSTEQITMDEGKNTYTVSATDLALNVSAPQGGDRYYLPGPLNIIINTPSENPYIIDDLPPSAPRSGAVLKTKIKVEIEDNIGNVPETILYCRIKSGTQDILLKNTNRYYYEGEVTLTRGSNVFTLVTEDMAQNKIEKKLEIIIEQ
jgi:hypothetical protein